MVNEIVFPSRYKKPLLNKTKNTTIRIKKEIGKYCVGKVYSAKSYSNKSWGIKIKVLEIIPTTINNLARFNIPKRTINSIKNNNELNLNEKAEIIKFKIL